MQVRTIRAALAIAAAAGCAVPVMATVTGGTGKEFLVSSTGATAVGAFTNGSNAGIFRLGSDTLTLGASMYTLTGVGGQTLGIADKSAMPLPIPTTADRFVYSYHETGSIRGIQDLVTRNGLLAGTLPPVQDSQRLYVMGSVITTLPASPSNGYGNFVDATPNNAPVPVVGGFYDPAGSPPKPTPQISYSDVRSEQAFAISGAASPDKRPLQAGYGLGQSNAAGGFNPGSTNFQQLDNVGALSGGLNPATTNVRNESLAVVPFGIVANAGTGLDSITETDARFLTAHGRLANGANFNATGRFIGSGTRNQAGNNLKLDPSWADGERDRAVLSNYTANDGRMFVAGDEADPELGLSGNSLNPNESRASAIARFADKTSGGGGLRPTVLGNRMAVGLHLSAGDIGSRGRSNSTTEPLRVLAVDWDRNNSLGGELDPRSDARTGPTRAVQPTAYNVTQGFWQMWSASQAITVAGSEATGPGLTGGTLGLVANDTNTATGRPIYNDVDDDGSGVGVVRKFLDNLTQSIAVGFDTNSVTPIDFLIQDGFIPPALMGVSKAFDGDTQANSPRSTTVPPGGTLSPQGLWEVLVENPAGRLSANTNWLRAGDLTGDIAAQRYRIFDVTNTSSTRSPAEDVGIPFTVRTFLAGDMNGDGVRDLADTESWAQALSDTTNFLALNPTISAGGAVVSTGVLDIAGLTNGQLGLVALSDLNGNGNVVAVGDLGPTGGADTIAPIDREDVRFFLYGAAVNTAASAPSIDPAYATLGDAYADSEIVRGTLGETAQNRRELGVRLGMLQKNTAITRFNAELARLVGTGDITLAQANLARFEPLDVDFDDVLTRNDARQVASVIGKDYTSFNDVQSTLVDLVAANFNDDDTVITHISADGLGNADLSDMERIVKGLIATSQTFLGDFTLDGNVDVSDLGVLAANFRGMGIYTQGDATFDGLIDVSDLGQLAANFRSMSSFTAALSSYPVLEAAWASVPEPTTLGLLGLAGLGLRRRRA